MIALHFGGFHDIYIHGVQETYQYKDQSGSIPSIDESRGTTGIQSVRTYQENDR